MGGRSAFWRVENGAMSAESSKDMLSTTRISGARIWGEGFRPQAEIKCEIAGGSGIQYRSQTDCPGPSRFTRPKSAISIGYDGAAADFWFPVIPCPPPTPGPVLFREHAPRDRAWRGEVGLQPRAPVRGSSAPSADRTPLAATSRSTLEPVRDHRPRGTHDHIPQRPADGRPDDARSGFAPQQPAGKNRVELEGTPAKVSCAYLDQETELNPIRLLAGPSGSRMRPNQVSAARGCRQSRP